MTKTLSTRKRDGVVIQDQWELKGHREGKRWRYRLWNGTTKTYRSSVFDSDPERDEHRRHPGCAAGDAWAIEEQAKTVLKVSTPSNTKSLSWVGERYLESRTDSDRSEGHLKAISWTLAVAKEAGVEDLSDEKVPEILQSHLRRLIARRPGQKTKVAVSGRVKNHHISILGSIGDYAEARGWVSRNPFTALQNFAENNHLRKVYAIAELRTLLARERQSDPWFRFVALAAYTGLRSETLRSLTWPMINWDLKRLHVPAEFTKTRDDVRAPLQPELLALLEEWRDKKATGTLVSKECAQATSDRANEQTQKYLLSCGIEPQGRSVHAFRHTAASLLTATGMTAFSVMDAIGHSSTVSSKHYSRGADDFRAIVADEAWDEGRFHLRGLPPALTPFPLDLIREMVKSEHGPSPAWLLIVLTIFLGIPAQKVVRLRGEHVRHSDKTVMDPTNPESVGMQMLDDLYELFRLRSLPMTGPLFPISWMELTRKALDSKVESFWEDIGLPKGSRRCGALWLSIAVLRKTTDLQSEITVPEALQPLLATSPCDYGIIAESEDWDGHDLWLVDRRRSRTVGKPDLG